MLLRSFLIVGGLVILFMRPTDAQTLPKLKDFRGTPQSLAVLGATSEFVEPAVKEQILQNLRRQLNRFSRSFGENSIGSFKLNLNPGDQFYRPVFSGEMAAPQKDFLKAAAKDNSIDILVLTDLRDLGDGATEISLQLFDSRIETLSGVERAKILRPALTSEYDSLSFRILNYLDREGFVHPEVQNFLEEPPSTGKLAAAQTADIGAYSVNPTDLSAGRLAGGPNIGGDKTPFWEKWWFWTIVGGSLATAGGLSYYFLVVDKDPNQGQVTFRFQD